MIYKQKVVWKLKTINGRLIKYDDKRYKINHKRTFSPIETIRFDDKQKCFDFAYDMAFGAGRHRATRSGGKRKRHTGEIFIDTFQGKVAEYAIYRYLMKYDIITTKPDMTVEGYGIWDSFDLKYKNIHMAVKSTKFYGNLLLLETKDWNNAGEYLPNRNNGTEKYDIFVLIRIAPDGEKEMRKNHILYSEQIDKENLKRIVFKFDWSYDIAGFITNADFVRLIEKKYILPRGAILNDDTYMDAENYYVQAGDMRTAQEMINLLIKYKQMFEQ